MFCVFLFRWVCFSLGKGLLKRPLGLRVRDAGYLMTM